MRPLKIAFVCLHGSAKSLIASAYFNRLARARNLPMSATTSGPEPDPAVPANVVDGLRGRGIDVGEYRPVLVAAEPLGEADLIVSFGCDVATRLAPGKPEERWDDCPAVSADFGVAWAYITHRVDTLIARLEN